MSVSHHPRALAGAALVAVLALLTACGASPGTPDSTGAPDGTATTLADVTPLADPASYVGPSSARVAEAAVEPVSDAPQPQLPVTVTDAQGTEVTVDDASRILAFDVYGTLARTVFELGLGDNVVGRDTSSSFDEIAHLPNVTPGGHELSGEAVLGLAPTVVLTDTSIGPWDVVLQLRDAGIPVVVVDSQRSLGGVADLTQQVADALGVHDLGVELAQRAQAEIDAKVAEIAGVAPQATNDRLRMVFLYVRGQAGVYYMFGEGSGADDLIAGVGGLDVAAEIGWDGMKPVNDEGLVRAQPDVVIVMTKGLDSVGGVDGLLERLPAVAQTPAGQHRRVVDMPDTQVLSFGPRAADTLDALARAIYAPGS